MHRLRRYFDANEFFRDITTESNEIILTIPKVLESKDSERLFYLEKSKPPEAQNRLITR